MIELRMHGKQLTPVIIATLLLAGPAVAQHPSAREVLLGVSGDPDRMVTWTALEGTVSTPIQPTTCDPGWCPAPQAAGTNGTSFLTLEYAFDADASVLALILTGKFNNNLPGWAGLGFRQGSKMASEQYSTMGPADFVLNYNSPTSGAGCAVDMHLDGASNGFPTVATGSKRTWTLYEPAIRSFTQNGTLKAQYLISPVAPALAASLLAYRDGLPPTPSPPTPSPPVLGANGSTSSASSASDLASSSSGFAASSPSLSSENTSSSNTKASNTTAVPTAEEPPLAALPGVTMQLLVAMANHAQIDTSATTDCSGGGKHDVLALLTELTLPQKKLNTPNPYKALYTLPAWPNGCHYGVVDPKVLANETAAPHCVDPCFSGFQGQNCSEKCSCSHGTCPDSVFSVPGDCGICDSGYFGPQCAPCSCNAVHTTSCVDGVNGNGFCLCKAPWGGPSCDDCDSTHYGPNCSQVCTCVRGVCNTARNGSSDGSCVSCTSGFFGKNCDTPCQDCDAGFLCSDGPLGTGACIKAPVTPAPATPAPVEDIELIQCVSTWTMQTFNRDYFLTAVAAAVSVHSSEISIVSVVSGSVIVQFKFINMNAATIQSKYSYFLLLYTNNATSLDGLRLVSAVGKSASQLTAAPPSPVPATPLPATPAPPTPAPNTSASGSAAGSGTSTPAPDTIPRARGNQGLPTGTIIALSLGLVVAVSLVAVIIYCGVKSNKSDRRKAQEEEAYGERAGSQPKRKLDKPKLEDSDDDDDMQPQTKAAFGVSGGSSKYVPTPKNQQLTKQAEAEAAQKRAQEKHRRELLGDDDDEDDFERRPLPTPGPSKSETAGTAPSSGTGLSNFKSQLASNNAPAPSDVKRDSHSGNKEHLETVTPLEMSTESRPGSGAAGRVGSGPPSARGTSSLTPTAAQGNRFAITSTNKNDVPPQFGAFGAMNRSPAFSTFAPPAPTTPTTYSPPGSQTLKAVPDSLEGSTKDADRRESALLPVQNPMPRKDENSSLALGQDDTVVAPPPQPVLASKEKKEKKSKKCKFCNLDFDGAPPMCAVDGRPHNVIKAERKAEKKSKKAAKSSKLAEQLADDSEMD